MVSKGLKCLKKVDTLNLKIVKEKTNASFMIYANVESILVPEDNGRENPEESCKNKCQKHISCNYDHKLACLDDKFTKPFKSCLGQDDR